MGLTTYFEQTQHTLQLNHNASLLALTWKSPFARTNTNGLSPHNIRSHLLHNSVQRHDHFGVMHFPIHKNWRLSPLQPVQWPNLSQCFAGAETPFSTDTWRREHKSRTLKQGQYFPALPRDVSARPTRKSREQKKFSNARYNVVDECALLRCLKYIFPHQTRYLTVQYKYEQVQNINVQNLWKQQAKSDRSSAYT